MLFDATADGRTQRLEVLGGRDGRYTVTVDGRTLDVDLREAGANFLSLLIGGRSYHVGVEKRSEGHLVLLEDEAVLVELAGAARGAEGVARKAGAGPLRVLAPMPGKVLRLLVEPGQEVDADQGLLVMEAMKMENEIRASRAGWIKELSVREGQAVETGALLAVLE